jgi:4-hydroxy-2-oxoheptanedioate aldolase
MTQMTTGLRARLAERRTTYGVWSALDDPVSAEIVSTAGFDLVCVDLQHGFADLGSLPRLLHAVHAAGSASLVRVAWNAPDQIMRALDLGADGVLVPMVDDAEQARRAVAACRYAPAGSRSWGPLWGDVRRGAPEPATGDSGAACIVMIETAAGLDNVEEIAAVPGLDAVYVGPNDLALSLGRSRTENLGAPEFDAVVGRVVGAAHAAGVAAGLDCAGIDLARRWTRRGVDLTICARDSVLLREAVDTAARALRAEFTDGAHTVTAKEHTIP